MDQQEDFCTWDAYFLGYDSKREPIGATADKLADFVSQIFPKPPQKIFEKRVGSELIPVRSDVTTYKRLVLVGHSQGGVVIRKAVAEAVKDGLNSSPLSSAEIILFAPALFGMSLSSWYGTVGETPLWRIVRPVLSRSPSYKELQAGSQFLETLRNETERLAAESKSDRPVALSARIVWATYDGIVQGGMRYRCDPSYRYLDKDHAGVCKPNSEYREPISFVLGS